MKQVLTNAVRLVKVVSLQAICVKLSSSCEDGQLAPAGRCHWVFDVRLEAVEVSVEYAWLPLFTEKNKGVCERLKERCYWCLAMC